MESEWQPLLYASKFWTTGSQALSMEELSMTMTLITSFSQIVLIHLQEWWQRKGPGYVPIGNPSAIDLALEATLTGT